MFNTNINVPILNNWVFDKIMDSLCIRITTFAWCMRVLRWKRSHMVVMVLILLTRWLTILFTWHTRIEVRINIWDFTRDKSKLQFMENECNGSNGALRDIKMLRMRHERSQWNIVLQIQTLHIVVWFVMSPFHVLMRNCIMSSSL